MAAANLVEMYDPQAAEKMSRFEGYVPILGRFARYIQEEVRTWTCRDPFKRMARQSDRTSLGIRAKLEWLLEQKNGIFIVQPVIASGGNSHVIGVDCSQKLIYDPLEEHALRLCRDVMGLCAGGGVNECIGIGEVRELLPGLQPRGRKRRSSQKWRKRSRGGGTGSSEEYYKIPRVG